MSEMIIHLSSTEEADNFAPDSPAALDHIHSDDGKHSGTSDL